MTGWELLKEYNASLPRFNEKRATPGTFRKSSALLKPDQTPARPYGGRQMSAARLKAAGPTRNYVAAKIHDITM